MKKRILIALALCMALGTACGKKETKPDGVTVQIGRGGKDPALR